jgi:hypothetical protein
VPSCTLFVQFIFPRIIPDKGRKAYPNWVFDSICLEKSARGPTWPDANLYRAAAFRAMALIGRFRLIDVNPYVDITTGKMYANKSAICRVRGGGLRIAGKIKIFARHLPLPGPAMFNRGYHACFKKMKLLWGHELDLSAYCHVHLTC